MITFALWVVGLAVVAAGVTGVKSAIDKRAGMGEWAEHGPNPSKQRIAHVEHSRELYRSAVAAMVEGRATDAQALWRQSADLGHLPAYTGLGIVEILEGRSWGTTAHWLRAAEGGDVAAQILQELKGAEVMTKYGHDAPPITASEFAMAFLRAQNRSDLDSLHTVIGTALHLGEKEFASEWARTRDIMKMNASRRERYEWGI